MGQSNQQLISAFLESRHQSWGLSAGDLYAWEITDEVYNRNDGSTMVYIIQTKNGIRIENMRSVFTISSESEIVSHSRSFQSTRDLNVSSPQPKLGPNGALAVLMEEADLEGNAGQLHQTETYKYRMDKGDLAFKDIEFELVYFHANGTLKLGWLINCVENGAQHDWYTVIDARNGKILKLVDLVTHCSFGDHAHHDAKASASCSMEMAMGSSPAMTVNATGGTYNVFPFPVESPIHGQRSVLIAPEDSIASPFGWHDTNGVIGNEFSLTLGNNVFAYTDTMNNGYGWGQSVMPVEYQPDGGSNLNFDFPFFHPTHPRNFQDVAVTNLFYANNRIHDVMYHYGFDEQHGNFQFNNYGNGGLSGDGVMAEAQDGSALSPPNANNANFWTPSDGTPGRMQMFLWDAPFGFGAGDYVEVLHPASIWGTVESRININSPLNNGPVQGKLVLVDDGIDIPSDGCDSLLNGSQINGNIALLHRSDSCGFNGQVLKAQNEGAIGVLIINTQGSALPSLGVNPGSITIPWALVDYDRGQEMLALVTAGDSVQVNMSLMNDRDGDLDNGIIVHEYGHGISNRLVGGPTTSGCLGNAEQMGEGWSDYYSLLFTMDTSVADPTSRGIGTYALYQQTDGTGIRPARYDTSFLVNDYTYADVQNTSLSQPHGIGFVWCAVLWDMTWALIDMYGFDPNIDSGSGGNNISMHLVTRGLMETPCNPGFVDGRDAILRADTILYGGAHACLIWETFARRGLGRYASQGDSDNRSDQTADFNPSWLCFTPTDAPVADFDANAYSTCTGKIRFTDQSYQVPHSWFWEFGDGQTSTQPNPTHVYANPGIYTVKLTVSNAIGSNTKTWTNMITYGNPPEPMVTDGVGCSADTIALIADGLGIVEWRDDAGKFIAEGDTLFVMPSLNSSTYSARTREFKPSSYVGPQDHGIGTAAPHSSAFFGALEIETDTAVEIVSAWVDSDSIGPRIVYLLEGGSVIDSVAIDVPFLGPGRVHLGLQIPAAGTYSFGLNFAYFWRNSGGVSYPYNGNLIDIVGSSAGGNFYYYFYDLEVRKLNCWSDTITVQALVTDTSNFSWATTNLNVDFLDNTPGATSWSWDFGDGNTASVATPSHTYAQAGTYLVQMTTDIGCDVKHLVSVGAIGVEEHDMGILMYPNPSSDHFMIQFESKLEDEATLYLYAMDGRLLRTVLIPRGKDEWRVDSRFLSNGWYHLWIDAGKWQFRNKLMILKN
jgi:PKD repeat protein